MFFLIFKNWQKVKKIYRIKYRSFWKNTEIQNTESWGKNTEIKNTGRSFWYIPSSGNNYYL